jgi:hypothetical protein
MVLHDSLLGLGAEDTLGILSKVLLDSPPIALLKGAIKLLGSGPQCLLARRISEQWCIEEEHTEEGDQAGSAKETSGFPAIKVTLGHVDLAWHVLKDANNLFWKRGSSGRAGAASSPSANW